MKIRDRLLQPLSTFLVWLHLPPWVITIAGILCMAGFAWWLPTRPILALISAALSFLADALDGAVARRTHVSSDQGKFIDMTADSLSCTLFLSGLVRVGWLEPLTGLFWVYFVLLSKVLHIIWRTYNGFWPSDWYFRAVAGYISGGSYILLLAATILQILGRVNYSNGVAKITLAILVIDCATVAIALSRYSPTEASVAKMPLRQ